MRWIWLALGFLALFAAARVMFKRPGQEITWIEFEHWVGALMFTKKDGGTLTISPRGSRAHVRCQRVNGQGDSCDLLVSVPTESPGTERTRERIRRLGIGDIQPDPSMLQIRVAVPDVFDPAAGASGARLAHVLFEELGIEYRTASFDVSLLGDNSARSWRDTGAALSESGSLPVRVLGNEIEKGVREDAALETDRKARSHSDDEH